MKEYNKEFELRWSDIDANYHVSHTSYGALTAHLRLQYLNEHQFGMKAFAKFKMGPVLFLEQYYYLKEVMPEEKISIDLQLSGISEDERFFQIQHNIYKENGERAVFCLVKGSWIDLKTRKLIAPPEGLKAVIDEMPKSKNFKILSKEDIRVDIPEC